jgi:hypothetical protein
MLPFALLGLLNVLPNAGTPICRRKGRLKWYSKNGPKDEFFETLLLPFT